MSARDVIAWTMKSLGAFDPTREADAVLVALHAAGFRILGPDEVDAVTVEEAAKVAETTWLTLAIADTVSAQEQINVSREETAAAIRALASGESR